MLTADFKEVAFQGALDHPFTGVGPFLHNDPQDRPPDVFDREVSLHFGADKQPYVLVPIVPRK